MLCWNSASRGRRPDAPPRAPQSSAYNAVSSESSMRFLVISDIHANLQALTACMEAFPDRDATWNLGDLVGYGAAPNEVIARSRELGTVFVRGNHDKACSGLTDLDGFNPIAALAALWTQKNLTPENLEFLQQLPHGPVSPLPNAECVHGSARDEDDYVLVARDAYPLLEQSPVELTFFGHTHIQCGFSRDAQNDLRHTLVPN